jgi:hypothetical protein
MCGERQRKNCLEISGCYAFKYLGLLVPLPQLSNEVTIDWKFERLKRNATLGGDCVDTFREMFQRQEAVVT